MLTTTEKKFLDSAIDLDSGGAGGEPLGEPPATPSRTQRRSRLSNPAVDDAVDRATLREMVKRPDGDRIPDEVIDQLLAGAETDQEIAGPGGLLAQLTKRLVERAMEVELTDHLGYEPHQEPPGGAGNTRNGTSPKTLVGEYLGMEALFAAFRHDLGECDRPARARRRPATGQSSVSFWRYEGPGPCVDEGSSTGTARPRD